MKKNEERVLCILRKVLMNEKFQYTEYKYSRGFKVSSYKN